MKKALFTLLFAFTLAFYTSAQQPPHPNGGNEPGSGNTPVGGAAPIEGGLFIMLAAASAYTIRNRIMTKS